YAAIPGGQGNAAEAQSTFAAGNRAKARNAGEFVWADGSNQDFPAAAESLFTPVPNDYLVRATGGVVFATGVSSTGAATAGARLPQSPERRFRTAPLAHRKTF